MVMRATPAAPAMRAARQRKKWVQQCGSVASEAAAKRHALAVAGDGAKQDAQVCVVVVVVVVVVVAVLQKVAETQRALAAVAEASAVVWHARHGLR